MPPENSGDWRERPGNGSPPEPPDRPAHPIYGVACGENYRSEDDGPIVVTFPRTILVCKRGAHGSAPPPKTGVDTG